MGEKVFAELDQFTFQLHRVSISGIRHSVRVRFQAGLHSVDLVPVSPAHGLLQFRLKRRRNIKPPIIRGLDIGQIAGNGFVPEDRCVQKLFGCEIVRLAK